MNVFQTVILISLIGNAGLGFFVLMSNPKRSLNIAFFALSLLLTLWLGSMLFASVPYSPVWLLFFVRQTSAFAAMVPVGVFALHFVIVNPETTFRKVLYTLRYWLLACLALVVLCHSSFFIVASTFPSAGQSVPVSQYGTGLFLYLAFLASVVWMMTVEFRRTTRIAVGAPKAEIRFLQLGCWLGFSGALLLYGTSVLCDVQEISRFMPLNAVVFGGFVAYGIATRRILSASAVLQRVVALLLVVGYLTALYAFSAWLGGRLLIRWVDAPADFSRLLAALIVAFSVAPARGWTQTFTQRFFSAHRLNMDALLESASQMFQELSTEAHLMAGFSELVTKAFGSTKMVIMRPDGAGAYTQVLPEEPEEALLPFLPGHAIVDLLVRDREAFTVDTLRRMKPTPLTEDALKALVATGAELMVGSFMRKKMNAMVFLFQKESGRFYDSQDQRALQLLCNQLAVALENASLYTAVQDGKIYNDILLDSLASGIVAANSDRIVTVFNRRARGLTGLPESSVVGQSMTVLPPALGDGLNRILNTQAGFRDQDVFITHGNEEVPVRVSGTHFRSHNGERFGALLVFNDMTALRKMEEQIRRNDRLSSLGTLSAGMAHEIKNPLVTIKTFTQLLPRQYQDAEFRQTFFELVGREVSRIDVIVNRLLEFSGPAKAMLRQASLHGIIEHSLRLVGHQLVLNGIRLERHLEAANDTIHADTEQLNQAFVNLLLNAVHAMNEGDTLTVRTSVMVHSEEIPQIAGAPDGDRIQVDIQDTGCGIAPEDLRRIFDPFFTTKASGVGLGLSVSHGIIQEHGGTIEVESERGKGTVFHLRFPLMNSPEKKDI